MKKRIFLILAMVLTLSFFLASCNFTVDFSGCSGLGSGVSQGTQNGTQITPEADNTKTDFRLTVEKKDGLYYPTFSGTVKFDYYPEIIAVEVDGISYNLTPKTMKCVHGEYIFTFNNELTMSHIDKGENLVRVYGFAVGGEKFFQDTTYTFIADDNYFSIDGWWDWDDEYLIRSGMDKEGNWTPFV